jgi:1-deoxy-D-xylulose-5-phosphate reductoisomerase
VIAEVIQAHAPEGEMSMDSLLEAERWARATADSLIAKWL